MVLLISRVTKPSHSGSNGQHIARNAEIFHGARQSERVWRNDAHVTFKFHQRASVKFFGIDDGGIDVGENAELVGNANVVAVGGHAVADDSFADLAVGERLDHFMFQGHFANPAIRSYRHPVLQE